MRKIYTSLFMLFVMFVSFSVQLTGQEVYEVTNKVEPVPIVFNFNGIKSSPVIQSERSVITNSVMTTTEKLKYEKEQRELEVLYGVKFPEREPVNFSKISKEHFQEGVIMVKFTPGFDKSIGTTFVNDEKFVRFNNPVYDVIHEKYSVKEYELHTNY